MRYVALAVMLVAACPLVAMAGDHSRFSFFFGLGGTDVAISNHRVSVSVGVPVHVDYQQCAPTYYAPPVCAAPVYAPVYAPVCADPVYAAPVYAPPAYCQPPVVVYTAPRYYPVYERFHEYRGWDHRDYAPRYYHR